MGDAVLPAIRAEVVRLRQAGHSYGAIAKALGITKNAAIGHGARAGLQRSEASPIVRGPVRPWTEAEDARLLALLALRHSDRDIAAALGRGVASVAGRIKSLRIAGHHIASRVNERPLPPLPGPTASAPALPGRRPEVSRQPIAAAASIVDASPGSAARAAHLAPAPAPPARGSLPTCRTCQWPEGETRRAYVFCAAPAVRGPYCAAHAARAYVSASQAREEKLAAEAAHYRAREKERWANDPVEAVTEGEVACES